MWTERETTWYGNPEECPTGMTPWVPPKGAEFGQFVVKSSGRKVFESGAMRDADPSKPRYDLIDPGFLLRLAEQMRKGAEHYGLHNWTKGIPSTNYMASLLRHVEAYRRGERDEDHLSAAVFNIMGLMRNEGTELDELFDWGSPT